MSHNKSLADVISDIVARAWNLGTPRLVVRSTLGTLECVQPGRNQPVYWLRQTESVTKITEHLASTDLRNRVVVLGQQSDTQATPIVATLDSDDPIFGPNTWGVRQQTIYLSQRVTIEEVQAQAQQVLNQSGLPRHERALEAPDIPTLRRYDQVRVSAGTLDGYYTVEGISHDEASGTMQLALGNIEETPVTGVFTIVDESAIPAETTGGSGGVLLGPGDTVSDAQRYALAKAAGFSGQDAVMAVAISLAEDPAGDPAARHANENGTTDLGLWQINSIHWPDYGGEGALVDPLSNAKAAFGIFQAAGNRWTPWATFAAGSYRQYLDRAQAASKTEPAQLPTTQAAKTKTNVLGNQALNDAIQPWMGTPYVLGGNTRSGVDCSAFTQAVFQTLGVTLPRTAQQQWNATRRVTYPKVGDLVFLAHTYDGADGPITHVGIYLGNGQVANAGDPNVHVSSLSNPYWVSHLAGYGSVR